MCAAIASARHGAKTALIQERPVLGGNASSEIRMWVCGAAGHNNRETGILEEIQLENLYRNPYKLWPVWDSILYEKARFEPLLDLFLNCTVFSAETDGTRIKSVEGWQMTTQERIRIEAGYFADCSGDSVLAPLTGAQFRVGREGPEEFGEKMYETEADSKTMGMSCLIQARKTDRPVAFKAPEWAKKLTAGDIQHRRPDLESTSENFWYLELGGDRDSIKDSEKVRDELLALAFGMWDYIKNSGEFDAALWQLDFVGFLPGKRESRRMTGAYTMTQGDIMSGGKFADTIAYGGWPLDDHDPAGFWHEGRPNISLPTPSPYGIPYRCIYSTNIENLFFAGRNISMTHAAMSSARVMATCALLGQAAGTAAAMCVKYGCAPREIYDMRIAELQQTLIGDDIMLPGIKTRLPDATRAADYGNAEALRDGNDRENVFLCENGESVTLELPEAMEIESMRIVFDSDLDRTTLPGDGCERGHSMRANVKPDSPVMTMPSALCRSYELKAETESGEIITLERKNENIKRLVRVKIGRKIRSVSFTPLSSWCGGPVGIFSMYVI